MVRTGIHFVLIVPAAIGLLLTVFLAVKSIESDVSDESFVSLFVSARDKIFSRIPAGMPGSWDSGEEDADQAEPANIGDLSPEQARTYAENNAFVASCAFLVLLGVAGIGLIGAATTIGEPIYFPLIRTAAMSGVAIIAYSLWGSHLAFPGESDGVVPVPYFGFPGGIDSVEYGLGGMSEWTDMFYLATYSAMFGCLLISFCSDRVKASPAFLVALPTTTVVLPIVVYWKWGAGWIDSMANNMDFAGAGLIHWHVGSVALLMGAILSMFLRQTDNRMLLTEPGSMRKAQPALYSVGIVFYFLMMIGMNCGSALSANSDIVAPVLQATLAAAGVAAVLSLVWGAIFRTRNLIQFLGIGLISGAVSVSGAADYLTISDAIALGGICGFVVPAAVIGMDKINWPDPLAVGPVHGISGAIGLIAASFVESDIEVTFAGQFIMLITVPIASLMIAFLVVVMAGIAKFLFVRPPAPSPSNLPGKEPPPLSRSS